MFFLPYDSDLREWIILPCVPLGFCRKGLSSNNWSTHAVHSSLHSKLRRPDSALSCAVCFAAAKAEVVPPQQVSVAGVWRGWEASCFFVAETH